MASHPAKRDEPMTVRQRFLVQKNRGLVYHLARAFVARYPTAKHLEDELVSEGMLGLIAAATSRSFDPTRVKFVTYAGRSIFRKMQRCAGEKLIWIPVYLRESQRKLKKPVTMPVITRFAAYDDDGAWEPECDDPPEAALALAEDVALLRRALRCLTPRERRIVRRRFGISQREGQTLAAISREMGITRERVRQVQDEALEKLRTAMGVAEPSL